ncbi:protein of unknown function [Pseudoxanthomonas sp. GM95]|uniref:T6SS immunity protein Tdi1 domain-containing protein n=1 Tax=Pseudoxanthomonas sp. GM95 TaxID=1881043 RepID=UPI0008CA35DA|nr:T6SS immunity protein Tdi1 domain-containing protein [Pseudoxanthomonas sp. GM95]SEK64984.1 protein of unknown function [Pseudoxanthomonas sp. GM95]
MAITLDELSVALGEAGRDTLLADWHWLTGEGVQPLMLTLAGDAFVQLVGDDGIYLLDCAQGLLQKVADDVPEFLAQLGNADFVADAFRFDLVAPRIREGGLPAAGQVLALRVPLPLGGLLETDNLEPAELAAHFALTGQLHAQVAALAPGQAVSDISFATE